MTLNKKGRTLIDLACEGEVEQIIEWNVAKNTSHILNKYAEGGIINPDLTEEELEMFAEADKILAEWKEKLNIDKIHEDWKQQRKHM